MDRKEAILRIKDHIEHHGIGKYPHLKLKEALDIAIAALDMPNEPLTWDKLGTMIEKPVYIVEMENGKSYWALVYTVSDTGTLLASAIDLNDYGDRELYGKSWLAYRRPPDGEEDT